MCPWNRFAILLIVTVWHELLEESSGCVCTAIASCTQVASVCDFGVGHFLFESRKERHWPSEFINRVSCFMDAGTEVVVVGPQSGCFVTESHDACAGEGCKVNDVFRIKLCCLPKSISKNKSSFCIGVEHFDGLSRKGRDDVTRTLCVGCRHVFCHAGNCSDLASKPSCSEGLHGPKDRCRAAHVVLHFVHVSAWFE